MKPDMTSFPFHDLAPALAPGRITINLGAIARNWATLAKLVAPARCAAVVKADAYGLGVDRVVPALSAVGCRTYFVATADEAGHVRALDASAQIFVLDGLLAGSAQSLASNAAIPCLASREDIAEWQVLQRTLRRALPGALNLDTGLNRLGLSQDDIRHIAKEPTRWRDIPLALVMSHLACADDPTDPMNEAQRTRFETMRMMLPSAPASLAASDGLMLGAAYHYDLVRPGYALYGGQAFRGARAPVEPVVTVEACILQVRDVPVGGCVGYSGTWRARRDSRVAIIAAGYADGIPRSASAADGESGGHVAIAGKLYPVIGRVSMDLITVDVTDAQKPIVRGDLAELVGPNITLETAGQSARTIGYEMLTRLGRRFNRIYTAGDVADG